MGWMRKTLTWGSLFCSLLTACAGDEALTEDELGEIEQPIINGYENNDPAAVGAMYVRHGVGMRTPCSGILLRNRVVLTARHCVTKDHTTTGVVDTDMSNYAVIFKDVTYNVQSATANPNNEDLAILILTQGVLINGSRTAWRLAIYPSTNGSLQGQAVVCAGYGSNTINTGVGVYRVAQIPVFHATTSRIYLRPNGGGQIPWQGDSGGACVVSYNGALHIAGIMTNARLNPERTQVVEATLAGAPTFKAWADSISRFY